MFARRFNHRHEGIVILHLRASLTQKVHQNVTGRFALVIHVWLVSQAQDQRAATLDRLALAIQRVRDTMHNVLGHGGVDLACKLDEARVFAILSRFPRKVEWIDWDAVTPKAGTRIERHKAKWLRFRGFNDFPDINPHRAVNEFQLINQRDIYAAENVLQ